MEEIDQIAELEDMEITFSHEHIKNNLHVEHSHWKLIGNCLKDPVQLRLWGRYPEVIGLEGRKSDQWDLCS